MDIRTSLSFTKDRGGQPEAWRDGEGAGLFMTLPMALNSFIICRLRDHPKTLAAQVAPPPTKGLCPRVYNV